MKEYNVRIRETLEMTMTVEAESAIQARKLVEQKWKDSEYILGTDHF